MHRVSIILVLKSARGSLRNIWWTGWDLWAEESYPASDSRVLFSPTLSPADPPNRPPTQRRFEPVSQPLLKLFVEYKKAECKDRRDKIFGLCSLADSYCKDAMPVNYSLTWSFIFQRLIRHQILHHHSVLDCVRTSNWEFRVQMFQRFCREVEERLAWFFITDMTPDSKTELRRPERENIAVDFDDICLRWAEKKLSPHSNYWYTIPDEYLRIYTRGRVCYTSLQLSTDFSKQRSPVPELSMMIKLQIRFLCSLVGHDAVSHPHATTEIDLVGDLLLYLPCSVYYTGDLKSPFSQKHAN
jgi:hypothetical protein